MKADVDAVQVEIGKGWEEAVKEEWDDEVEWNGMKVRLGEVRKYGCRRAAGARSREAHPPEKYAATAAASQ